MTFPSKSTSTYTAPSKNSSSSSNESQSGQEFLLIDDTFFLLINAVLGATNTGTTSPGTMADDDSVGTVAWDNPVNAKTSNDSDTGMALGDGLTSHYLKATNFGFSIPSGVTINGIKAEIEQAHQIAAATENSIKIVKGGSILGNEKSTGAETTDTDTYITYGSSSDLWGLSWTASDINNSGFGIVYSVVNNSGGVIIPQVDHIRITIYYTEAGGTDYKLLIQPRTFGWAYQSKS